MIRTVFTPAPLSQFNWRWENITHRARRSLFTRCRNLRTRTPSPIPNAPAVEEQLSVARRREECLAVRSLYDLFEEEFDGLVGLLCSAAQEGVTAKREAEYLRRRDWFRKNYGTIRFYLTVHQKNAIGSGMQDAFEALFLPETLNRLLAEEDCRLIDCLNQAQEVSHSWYRSLLREEASLITQKSII